MSNDGRDEKTNWSFPFGIGIGIIGFLSACFTIYLGWKQERWEWTLLLLGAFGIVISVLLIWCFFLKRTLAQLTEDSRLLDKRHRDLANLYEDRLKTIDEQKRLLQLAESFIVEVASVKAIEQINDLVLKMLLGRTKHE